VGIYTATTGGRRYDTSKLAALQSAVGAEGFRGAAWREEVWRRLPIIDGLKAVGLTQGAALIDAGEAELQTLRQASFPMRLLKLALTRRVQDGETGDAADHERILAKLEADYGTAEILNERLHGIFAAGGWRLMLEHGQPMAPVASTLAKSGARTLALSLRGCAQFTDTEAALLAASLPASLEEVSIELVGSRATASGGRALLDAVVAIAPNKQRVGLAVMELNDCLLTGPIPPLGELTALVNLTLAGNRLSGAIPPSIGKCTRLMHLELQNNELDGPLPVELAECTALRIARLNGNRLVGGLPAELGRCTQLCELRLQNNQLSGGVPAALADCRQLHDLMVDGALLEGGLPLTLQQRVDEKALWINRPRGAK